MLHDIIEGAWAELPEADRRLLENVGRTSWQVIDTSLAAFVADIAVSAGVSIHVQGDPVAVWIPSPVWSGKGPHSSILLRKASVASSGKRDTVGKRSCTSW